MVPYRISPQPYFTPISSLRTIFAPSTSALSFIFATIRASGFMPQSELSVTFSGGTTARTFLIRPTIFCGVSIAFVRMSSTPICSRLVLREVLQELDARHVAVRVVEHELVDALGVEEIRQDRLVAFGEVGAQDVVAPRVAEAEVPADLRVHAVAALLDDFPNPLVVVHVVGEERQPRAEVFELQVLGAGGHELLHLRR